MTTLFYLWLLFAPPADRPICALWVSETPDVSAFRAACPWPLPNIDALVWRAENIVTGLVLCERPASELPALNCNLWPIDHYRIVVVDPDHREVICGVAVTHPGRPTSAEIITDCPQAAGYETFEMRYTGEQLRTPPPAPCRPPDVSPADASADIATQTDYRHLAARLLWWGYVDPDCGSYSGIDPVTGAATDCGMRSARSAVIAWQNRMDTAIRESAVRYGVPPAVLKRVIETETQFWPLWTGIHGESGMIQLTDQGADTALRHSPDLYAWACPLAIYPELCGRPYDTIGSHNQELVRTALLASIRIGATTPEDGMAQALDDMDIYAMTLAGYYCHAAANGQPSWDAALAAWNEAYR